MIAEYKRHIARGIGIGVILEFVGEGLRETWRADVGIILIVVGWFLFYGACSYLAQGKGYDRLVGIFCGLLGILGVLILLILPDKTGVVRK